ncbi:hypothetical protein BT69DRAFT_1343774 [Atractiella rhizophila]|nr:hypothetical protein BT69DRAFT_1343774 [Atractiella rhizophila]
MKDLPSDVTEVVVIFHVKASEERYRKGIHWSDFNCSTYGWLEDVGEQLEYGKGHEGYWDAVKLIEQVEKKFIPVFERLHPGQTVLVVFENPTRHGAMASDACNAKNMNLGPGGKQPR